MKSVLLVLLVMCLSACAAVTGLFEPLHAPQAKQESAVETPEQKMQKALKVTQDAIDEANALLISIKKTIGQNVHNKVWTSSEGQNYLDETRKVDTKLDQAREALRLGNMTDAQAQAEAVKQLILALQRRIAEAARQSELAPPIYT